LNSSQPNGIYSGYFTGSAEIGFGLLLIKDGLIVGADAGGVKFDGKYEANKSGDGFEGIVQVNAPPGGTLIQGIPTGPNGLNYEVKVHLPLDFGARPFIKIETPFGPINVKFVKIRDLD
jgi:hypothetical protein